MKPYQFYIILALLVVIILLNTNVFMSYKKPFDEPQVIHEKVIIKQSFYQRKEVNEKIVEYQVSGEYDTIYRIYNKAVGDNIVSALILFNCLAFGVPVNIGFALCERESGFKKDMVNDNKRGKKLLSRDYGLFMLNSITFQKEIELYGVAWLMMPENNVRLGIQYLRKLYDKYGTWNEAILHYNDGKDISNKGIKHFLSIWELERKYDRIFNKEL